MNAVKAYQLWYTANVPEHELRGLDAARGRANGQSMAEYLLREMDYANRPRTAISASLENQAITAYRVGSRQPIEGIHRACKDEIERNWQRPGITQEEFEEALFADRLEEELRKIPELQQVEIRL